MKRFLVLAMAAGCTPSVGHVADSGLPDGYVRIDRGEFEWRAISALGVVIGVRTFANDPAGTLDFWATVVRKELENSRQYVFESEEAVAEGRAMLFATPRAGAEAYWVVVWVQAYRIVTFEAAGPRADMMRDLPALKAHAAKVRALS
jgi:hypothetical protein